MCRHLLQGDYPQNISIIFWELNFMLLSLSFNFDSYSVHKLYFRELLLKIEIIFLKAHLKKTSKTEVERRPKLVSQVKAKLISALFEFN